MTGMFYWSKLCLFSILSLERGITLGFLYPIDNYLNARHVLFSSVNNGRNDGPRGGKPQTLYDILQSPPTATRDELKRQYVRLAKILHPDAVRRKNDEMRYGANGTITVASNPNIVLSTGSQPLPQQEPDFSDVAAAWRVLSDPRERKRYDRSLRAEEFTDNIERAASRFGDQVAPLVSNIFEKVAVPTLRRTTATTAAAVSAAASDIKATKFSSVVVSAFKAGRSAGRVVDSIELMEKSKEMRDRSRLEIRMARDVKLELCALTRERIRLSLDTPYSSTIDSREALSYLNGLNMTGEFNLYDFQEQYEEIRMLEDVEYDYQYTLDQHNQVRTALEMKKQSLKEAAREVEDAIMEEERAAAALRYAQQKVMESKRSATVLLEDLASFEPIHKNSASQMNRQKMSLSEQLERVRRALKTKAEEKRTGGRLRTLSSPYEDQFSEELALARISEMMEHERVLSSEVARMRDRALNLRASSKRLRFRSEIIRDDGNMGIPDIEYNGKVYDGTLAP